jgi:hypothetical protein
MVKSYMAALMSTSQPARCIESTPARQFAHQNERYRDTEIQREKERERERKREGGRGG